MSSTVKDALSALSRHSAYVAELVDGGTALQDSFPKATVVDLRQASAIRVAGPDTWRLHPRLREYLQEHVKMLSPFLSLTVIGPKVSLLVDLRDEILNSVASRDAESTRLLIDSMATAIYDIADAAERNLSFLSNMVSVRYGDVANLGAKVRQNRWYARQAQVLTADLQKLGDQATHLEEEAENSRWEVAPLLRREILGRLPGWKSALSDILSRLRSDIYNLRKVETDLRNLAKFDTFLAQQPGWTGLDMPLPEKLPDALLYAFLGALKPHADPNDTDENVAQDMELAVLTLPPPKAARQPVERVVQYVSKDEGGSTPEEEASVDPYLQVLAPLKLTILQAAEPVSLLKWQREHAAAEMLRAPAATELRAENWLMFAVWALEGRPHRVEGREVWFDVDLVHNAPAPGQRDVHSFRDAVVSARA